MLDHRLGSERKTGSKLTRDIWFRAVTVQTQGTGSDHMGSALGLYLFTLCHALHSEYTL